jgi:hypothetical protein
MAQLAVSISDHDLKPFTRTFISPVLVQPGLAPSSINVLLDEIRYNYSAFDLTPLLAVSCASATSIVFKEPGWGTAEGNVVGIVNWDLLRNRVAWAKALDRDSHQVVFTPAHSQLFEMVMSKSCKLIWSISGNLSRIASGLDVPLDIISGTTELTSTGNSRIMISPSRVEWTAASGKVVGAWRSGIAVYNSISHLQISQISSFERPADG